MTEHPLFYDLAYLKGMGPQRAAWIRDELGLVSFHDILAFFRIVTWIVPRYIPCNRWTKALQRCKPVAR